MSEVLYNGNTVSDEKVRRVLENICTAYKKDVLITSGDRSYVPEGGSKTSLHLAKRAADFGMAGYTLGAAFNELKTGGKAIFDPGESYEVIHHGNFTATSGPHLHVGHYPKGKGIGFVDFKTEGLTASDKGDYKVQRVLILPYI